MKIIAHRGNSAFAPENTFESFKQAIDIGVDFVECDILLTKDNVMVLNHDYDIDRTSTGKGQVKDHTYAELKTYDFGDLDKYGDKYKGTNILKAEDAFAYFKERNQPFYIDLNGGFAIPKLKEALDRVQPNMDDVVFLAGSFEEADTIHNMYPTNRIGHGMIFWQRFLKSDNREEYIKEAVNHNIFGFNVYYYDFIDAGTDRDEFADLCCKYNLFWGAYFAPNFGVENEETLQKCCDFITEKGSKMSYIMTNMPGIAKKLL